MNKKIIIFTLTILCLTTIVSSADISLGDTPSPTLHINENNTGQSEYNGPKSKTIQWNFTAANSIWSTPTIGENNTIYVTDYGSDRNNGFFICYCK